MNWAASCATNRFTPGRSHSRRNSGAGAGASRSWPRSSFSCTSSGLRGYRASCGNGAGPRGSS